MIYPFDNFSDSLIPDGTAKGGFIGDDYRMCDQLKQVKTTKPPFFGFPIEAISTQQDRADVISRFMNWCDGNYSIGSNVYLPLLIKPNSSTVLFSEDFSNDLSQWNLFIGNTSPFIDSTFGNPIPSYQNNGINANSGCIHKMGFTPAPGMVFLFDMQIDALDNKNGGNFGLSRIYNPTATSWDSRDFVYFDGPASRFQINDCGYQQTITNFSFVHFKFMVRDDYRLDAYVGDPGIYVCTTNYTVSEFVDKPIIINGRKNHVDNVVVYMSTP